jgi:hypothetical protein
VYNVTRFTHLRWRESSGASNVNGSKLASDLGLLEDASPVVWAAVSRACQLMTINADYLEVQHGNKLTSAVIARYGQRSFSALVVGASKTFSVTIVRALLAFSPKMAVVVLTSYTARCCSRPIFSEQLCISLRKAKDHITPCPRLAYFSRRGIMCA